MKKIYFFLFCLVVFTFYNISIWGQATFKVASGVSATWSSSSTWTVVSGSDADGIPDSDDNVILDNTYRSGDYTIIVSGTDNACLQLTVGYSGCSNTLTLYITGGSSSADALRIGNGTGYDLVIDIGGVVNNSAAVSGGGKRGIEFTSSSCGWQIKSTGKYIHNQNGGSFPDAISGHISDIDFESTSIFEVQNTNNWNNNAGGFRSNYRSEYGSLLINTGTNFSIGYELGNNNTLSINGDLTVKGNSGFRQNTSGSTAGIISIFGDVSIEDSSAFYGSSTSGNGGTISITGNITTSGSGYVGGSLSSGSALMNLSGDLSGIYESGSGSTSTLTFTGGTGSSSFTPDENSTFKNISINKNVDLGANTTISGTLTLTSGLLSLGNYGLTIGSSGSISGASSSNYLVTNGMGVLKRTVPNTDTYVSFPIGISSGYNPLNIKLSTESTTDIFSVNVEENYEHNPVNTNIAVNRQWNIEEQLAGGTSATIQFQFVSGDCAAGFNSSGGGEIGHWNGTAYDVIGASLSGSGTSVNPYIITNTTPITSFSPFITGNEGVNPIELISFTSSTSDNSVRLTWSTVAELNNSGFDVERKKTEAITWQKIGFVEGNGTTNTPQSYSFSDRLLSTGKFNYRLKQIDFNGNYQYYYLGSEVSIGVPKKFELLQNFPNPFNPVTKIGYELPNDSKVRIKIFDMLGREVVTLVDEFKTAGYHTVDFDGSTLSSGMYFYRIKTDEFEAIKKMLLIK